MRRHDDALMSVSVFSSRGRAMIRKLITSAALALGLAGFSAAPAQAFHGGGGGFHGGGFHGGGFHGGFGGFRGGGFHNGFGGFHNGFANRGFGFRRDRFGRGFFPFFGFGAGLAYAGAYPYYDYPYHYYPDYCYLRRQWVWNGYRHVYALVRVCQ
jgi:hypothetical protein